MSCTKPELSSSEIEEIVGLRVKEFEEKVEGKLAENNTRFEDLVRRQNEYEEAVVKHSEENVNLITKMKKDLMKNIDDGFLNNKKEFDKIFKENDMKIEKQIANFSQRLDDIELVINLERDRLNKVIDMSGFMAAEVEMLVKKREDNLNDRIKKMEDQVAKAMETVSDISQRVFNMDINKKNNLIFNGLIQEDGESKVILLILVQLITSSPI